MPPLDKVCLVCCDKALGYNFNAITCESCKAFFRRNALSNKEFTCPFNGNCEVTVVTRRFCQKCRLEKCFSVGMRKEYIMSDEDKILKRIKIERNRAKRKPSRENIAQVLQKIKREETANDPNDKFDNLSDHSDHGIEMMSSPDLCGSCDSPKTTDTSHSRSVQTDSELCDMFQVNSSMYFDSTYAKPMLNINSSSKEIVDRLVDYPDDATKLINHLMKTPSDAVQILTKILNSQTDAMRLISHLISFPGDALKIISKIMNSPFDALTVFTKFMSSPTDALEIIAKIASSPGEVLQFIQQLMHSPEDALQIMNKFMNTPAEALKMLNKMVNNPCLTTTAQITDNSYSEESDKSVKENSMIKSMLNNYKCTTNPNSPTSTQSCIPIMSCENTAATKQFNANMSNLDCSSEMFQDILEDVIDKPIHPNSLESVICDAIKFEYDAYNFIPPSNNNRRELNDAERAKLNELIVANKALYAPLEEDLSGLDECSIKANQNSQDPQLLKIINLTAIAIKRLIKMSKKINAFKNMCQEDQVALLKGGCTEMMILRSVMQYDVDHATWKIPHSHEAMSSITVDVLKLAKGNVYEEHESFIRTFDPKWRKDENIILIMCAIVLFTSTRPKTVHSDVLKLEQNTYYYLLRRYLESVYPGCEAKSTFLKLIKKIGDLQRLNEVIISVYLDVNPSQVEPLLREIFDLKNH